MSHLLPVGDTMQKQTADYATAAFTVIYALAAFALIVGTSLLTLTAATKANAASARVRSACMGDYLAYCSQHAPESAGVRKCMNAHGSQLSKSCVDALVAEGEVSRGEVQRRKTAAQH